MKSQLLVGEFRMERNIGLEEIVGDLTGEKLDSSESRCTETIWVLKSSAVGDK